MSGVHWLVILSALFSLGGSVAYIRDTLRGKTQPNRVAWSMWAAAPMIGTAAAISAHADLWATVRIFLASFCPLLVFIASFLNRQSYWKLTAFDLLCGLCSLLALALWATIDEPNLAILLAAAGDGFASLPTIRKAWISPETETGVTYLTGLISVILIIPSIPVWDVQNAAFQVYILAANTLLLVAVYRRFLFGPRRRLRPGTPSSGSAE